MLKRELYNNNARLHIELGFLLFTLLLSGCSSTMTVQEKLEYYNCYWNCPNDAGEIGWCCEFPVPPWHQNIFNCENAGERKVVR